jgi:hypothetical protein
MIDKGLALIEARARLYANEREGTHEITVHNKAEEMLALEGPNRTNAVKFPQTPYIFHNPRRVNFRLATIQQLDFRLKLLQHGTLKAIPPHGMPTPHTAQTNADLFTWP